MRSASVAVVTLVLALAASPISAQENLLDAHVYLDVALKPPFSLLDDQGENVYFKADTLEQARREIRQAMVAHLSRVGVFDVDEGAENDYPRLLIAVGCRQVRDEPDCPCDVGVTFTLLGQAGVLSESKPFPYGEGKRACITKVEVPPERLAPDLIEFLSTKTVEGGGFTALLQAVSGLEIAQKATPYVTDGAYRWLLPKTHDHRLLGFSPVFAVHGALDLPNRKRAAVPTRCEATYSGFFLPPEPRDGNGAGRLWSAEVRTGEKACKGPMSNLVPPFETIDASVRMISFEVIPSKLVLLGEGR